jgi:site-specific recombinase XerD
MELTYTFSIQPIVRRNKANAEGKVPVYFRILINSQPAEIASKQYVEPSQWDSKKGRVKGNTEQARTVNLFLDTIKAKLHKIFNQLEGKGETVSAQKIKAVYTGQSGRQKTLVEVFTFHNEKMKSQIGKEFAQLTWERYDTALSLIGQFMQFQYKLSDMALSDLNYQFITDLEYWFKTVRKCQHNTTMRYITNLRKIINLALANEWIEKDPFLKFRVTHKEVKREALTEEELEKIAARELSNQRLEQVRDVFIFCCYTGLAYVDVAKLSPEHIHRGIDGLSWIFTNRTKTKATSNIPLLPRALALVEKYRDHPLAAHRGRVLPVLTNQKMNAYLKEIGDLCGVNKTLTTHLARHTFATTVTLTNGIPMETVSSMLGHRSIKTTQIYAKVVLTKVSKDMEKIREKYKIPEKDVLEQASVGEEKREQG